MEFYRTVVMCGVRYGRRRQGLRVPWRQLDLIECDGDVGLGRQTCGLSGGGLDQGNTTIDGASVSGGW